MFHDFLMWYGLIGLGKAILVAPMSCFAGNVGWILRVRHGPTAVPRSLWVVLTVLLALLIPLVAWPWLLRTEGIKFFVLPSRISVMRDVCRGAR